MLYRYVGTDERIYPYVRVPGGCLRAVPGMDPIDLNEPPADGRWAKVPTRKAAAAKAAKE